MIACLFNIFSGFSEAAKSNFWVRKLYIVLLIVLFLMNKKLIICAVFAIAAIVIYGSLYFVNIDQYKNDASYCEKSGDCLCSGCGCHNKYELNKCISTIAGAECSEKGCQCINNKCDLRKISESEIDTDQEAIDYAKKDVDLIDFSKSVTGLDVAYNAYFNQELGVWQVVAYAKNANDLDYQISFYPNKTIAFKGPVPL